MQKYLRIFLIVLLVGAVSAGAYYWFNREPELSEGIASGNGRLEADEIQVATKYPGRVKEVLIREGDMVKKGQVIARMDTSELDAQILEADAQIRRMEEMSAQAAAGVTQAQTELALTQKQLGRDSFLYSRGHVPREQVDMRKAKRDTLVAAVNQGRAGVGAAQAAVAAAKAARTRLNTLIRDDDLVSTASGRVLYRLVEDGEVVGSGGRVATILDIANVYMTIFLPAADAGTLKIGDDARIVLDALPDYVIPSTISFVSPQAQFTPNQVETADEREKLMFRVKLSLPQKLLKDHADQVKTGLRGVAYVRTDPAIDWPRKLAVKLPDRKQ